MPRLSTHGTRVSVVVVPRAVVHAVVQVIEIADRAIVATAAVADCICHVVVVNQEIVVVVVVAAAAAHIAPINVWRRPHGAHRRRRRVL